MAFATTAQLPKNSLRRKSNLGKRIMRNWQLYLFILPALVYFIVFHYVPMYGVQIAFKDFVAKKGIMGSPWVGFEHFATFFHMEDVNSWATFVEALKEFFLSTSWTVILNTLLLAGYTLLAGFPIPVILALLLNEVKCVPYKKLVQNVTYAPNFISMVVMVGMINLFFANSGIVNSLLGFLGVPPTNFLMNAGAFRHLYVWTGVWQSTGWSSIIYFAALSSVDPQLHEAATIDGASRLQRLIHINIPTILPTMAIMLIMQVGTIMNVGFEKIYLMQNASNMGVSEVIATYVYKLGIQQAQISFSAAIGLFNNVVNLILLLIVNKVSKKVSDTGLW